MRSIVIGVERRKQELFLTGRELEVWVVLEGRGGRIHGEISIATQSMQQSATPQTVVRNWGSVSFKPDDGGVVSRDVLLFVESEDE